jgi:hypothetical protein
METVQIGGEPMTILMRERLPDRPGRVTLDVVLAHDGAGKYVTWVNDVESGGYFWGHYFEAFQYNGRRDLARKAATADFHARALGHSGRGRSASFLHHLRLAKENEEGAG